MTSTDDAGGAHERACGLDLDAVLTLLRQHQYDEDTTVTLIGPGQLGKQLMIAYSSGRAFAALVDPDRVWQLSVRGDPNGQAAT